MHRLIGCLALGLCCAIASADPIPRCWTADQPGQSIVDGMFRIFLPTQGHGALDVAMLLSILDQSMASKKAVGTRAMLDRIEFDVFGDTRYWRPSGTFPTLDSFKSYILDSLQPIFSIPDVTIECEATRT
jgi:hypothetical protein